VALTLTIDGVDKTSILKDGSLDVEKTGSTERLTLDVLIKNDNTASAYRPGVGDVVRLLHTSDLLGGGPIVRIEDRRLGGDSGTVTRITVRDWLYLAEQIIIDNRYFPPEGAFALFDYLVETYLVPKGVTNISSATTGGPELPELFVAGETLLSVFLQITEQTGYPFRINADKECALVEPGSLVWPGGGLTTSNIHDGLTWTQDVLWSYSRLRLTTGTPEAGAGPVTHFETRYGDGVLTAFPVNVLPNRTLVGRIDLEAGYTAGATSLALKDLTPGMEIREDNILTQPNETTSLVVQSDVVVDEDGKATVTISPGLVEDVADNDPMTFSDETGIILTVDGVDTPLQGGLWGWDRVHQAVANATTPPDVGVPVVVTHRVTFPAVVRVWETAVLPPLDADGYFDWQLVRDGVIDTDANNHTDLPQAAAYARDVLARQETPPLVVRCTTFEPGWYPFISTTITWAARLLSGTFMVDTVRVRAIGIDPSATTEELPYELELVEGDALRQSWVDYYRGQNPARGIRWGGVTPPVVPPLVEQFSVASHIDETSSAFSFDTTPTVGNLVVVCLMRANSFTGYPCSIADNQGNTYTKQVESGADTAPGIEMWTAPIVTAAGTFTVTITHNTFIAQHCDVALLEVAGADNAAPNHQDGIGTKSFGATTGTVDLPDVTVPCLVIGVGTKVGGASSSPATGWTLIAETSAGQGITVIAADAPDAGSYDPTWDTNSTGMDMIALAIKAAS
jgi:hypothetical protein